jgi:1,2-diacylglycerol 3-alpha-glucosyltransferase
VRVVVAAARRERFDALLAHNAEAALVALAARRFTRVPVVYVAHTLWRAELPTYGARALARPLARIGRALDVGLARRADAVLALSRLAADELGAARVLDVIPPGLDPEPAPEAAEVERACAHHGLAPGRYALYAGNLDGYQHLDLLDAAAARVASLPVVVATHARSPSRWRHLRVARSDDPAEVRALLHGAALLVTARAPHGGFPIKVLNYMEAGRAIVAREGCADSLRHGESAWLVPAAAGAAELAAAIDAIARDPVRAGVLGRGARAALEREHAWSALAQRTLALVARARSARPAR